MSNPGMPRVSCCICASLGSKAKQRTVTASGKDLPARRQPLSDSSNNNKNDFATQLALLTPAKVFCQLWPRGRCDVSVLQTAFPCLHCFSKAAYALAMSGTAGQYKRPTTPSTRR